MRFLDEATELPTCKDSFLRHISQFDEGRISFISRLIKATRLVGDRGAQARQELGYIEEELAFTLALGDLLKPYSSTAFKLKKELFKEVEALGLHNFGDLETLVMHYKQMMNIQINRGATGSVEEAMDSFRSNR